MYKGQGNLVQGTVTMLWGSCVSVSAHEADAWRHSSFFGHSVAFCPHSPPNRLPWEKKLPKRRYSIEQRQYLRQI